MREKNKNLSLVISTRKKRKKMKYKCQCGNYIYKYVDVTKSYPVTRKYKRRWYLKQLKNKFRRYS